MTVNNTFTGTVKWMNSKKGFGMIEAMIDDEMQDVFFHYSEIQTTGFKYLPETTPVKFELVRQTKSGSNGLKATKVVMNHN
ncbi:cold-shock DNA-binding domain protein [Vibrio phage 1.031.O._10N.261.46.F8]|nr:cold-shock DNA-binding domain protein [Vibrio phage 1.031.O._10N.261.46.F8]